MRLKYAVVIELSQLMTEARIKIRDYRDTALLDEVLEKLDVLVNSKSKLADYDELKSDMEWLREYYAKESWNDVTRWLTNIDSTLRETFSRYIESIKEIRGNNKWSSKKQTSEDVSDDVHPR